MNTSSQSNPIVAPARNGSFPEARYPDTAGSLLLQALARRSRMLERYLAVRAQRRQVLEQEIRRSTYDWQDLYLRLVQFNVLHGKEVIAPLSDEECERAARARDDLRRVGRAMGGMQGRKLRDLGMAIGSELHAAEKRMRNRLPRGL